MSSIIGLGNCGCTIAKKFEYFPQYAVYSMDAEQRDGSFLHIPEQSHPEAYENVDVDFASFLQDVDDEVLMIFAAGGFVATTSLMALEEIKNKKISVCLIKSDNRFFPKVRSMHERVIFGVLQEYARSAAIERIFLVDNSLLPSIVGDAPIIGFYDKMNEFIFSSINMVNVFKNSKPILSTASEGFKSARISTYGVIDPNTGKEKLFFKLDKVLEKVYYYTISEKRLKTDKNLLNQITEQIKNNNPEDIKVSYSIYSSSYEKDYGYIVANTSTIQKYN